MATNILYKKLSNAREEKDVDNAYAEAFMKAYKIDVIEHPFKCDGYIEDIFKKLIIEYKYDEEARRERVRHLPLQSFLCQIVTNRLTRIGHILLTR